MRRLYLVVIVLIAIGYAEGGRVYNTIGDVAASIIDSEMGALALDMIPYGDKVKSVLIMLAPPQRSPSTDLQQNDKSTVRRIADFIGEVMFFFLYTSYF